MTIEVGPATRLLHEDPPGVSTEVSPFDDMFEDDLAQYFGVARSALGCIRHALLAANRTDAARILDLPCGYGRVMRMLRAEFPEAELVACDVQGEGVDFCTQTFGATPVYSRPSVREIDVGEGFDLVWCGSLLTHLDAHDWLDVLSLFESALAPGGVLVFTTHGRHVADRVRRGAEAPLGRPAANVVRDFELYGFGYADYHQQPKAYGMSLSSPPWVCAQLERFDGLRLAWYCERGWDDNQDVVSCVRM